MQPAYNLLVGMSSSWAQGWTECAGVQAGELPEQMVPDDNDDLESDMDDDEAEDAQPPLQGISLPLRLGSLQGGPKPLLMPACIGQPPVIGALLSAPLQHPPATFRRSAEPHETCSQ